MLFWGGGAVKQTQLPAGKGGLYIPRRNGVHVITTTALRKEVKLEWVSGPLMNSDTIVYKVSFKASF